MQKNKFSINLKFSGILFLIALFNISCEEETPTPTPNVVAHEIVGYWSSTISDQVIQIHFNVVGEIDAEPNDIIVGNQALYEIEENVIIFTDDLCGINILGYYNFEIINDQLEFTYLNDACASRKNNFTGRIWEKTILSD